MTTSEPNKELHNRVGVKSPVNNRVWIVAGSLQHVRYFIAEVVKDRSGIRFLDTKEVPTVAPQHSIAFRIELLNVTSPGRDHCECILSDVWGVPVEIADFNCADPYFQAFRAHPCPRVGM